MFERHLEFVESTWDPAISGNEITQLEFPAPPYRHLVRRRHPWRRQLYIRGKNLTVRQLLGSMKANQLSPDEAAEDLGVTREAVIEALNYAEQHQDLLNYEAMFEREMIEKGQGHGPAIVPG